MTSQKDRHPFSRRTHHGRTTFPLQTSGRYAPFIVGPVVSLTVLCAHAQTTPPGTDQAATPAQVNAASAPKSVTAPSSRSAKTTNSATTLNTFEVTANRRREPAREVPMQLNVLSSQELQRKGATSMQDYLSKEPGVSLVSSGPVNQISMRGITTGSDISPTVGVYVDDIPFGGSTIWSRGAQLALDMGLLDLNHIEILRGPQGTLYGAGAMGGLLKYVTNEPDSDGGLYGHIGGSISGTDHGGLNHTENAVINVPIKDDVAALRISAFDQHDAGFVNRIGSDPESGVNEGTTIGGRASLTVTPTKDLTVRLTATTQQTKRDGTGAVDYNFTTREPLYGDLTQSRQVNEPYNQLIGLYSADIEYDFGWARLNAISAFQTIRTSSTADYSSVYVPLLNAGFASPIYNAAAAETDLYTKKFTQEFRLTSPANRSLEWVAGLFYTHETSTNDQSLIASGSSLTSNLLEAELPSTYKEYAAYGDLTYHFTTRLSATAGLRVAHNDQTFDSFTSGPLAGGTSNQPGVSADTSKTYLFTLGYQLTQNSNAYGRIASGYRPGGPQPSLLDLATGTKTPGTFSPDTLTSYELGYKADFLDKRASLSLSAYDIEWRSIQLSSYVNGLSLITNGGRARSQGLEFFGNLNPSPQWRLSGSLTYTDARLTQDVPGIQAVSGDRMPNTPTFSATLNADYLFTVDTYRAYVGATESYIGPRNSGFNNSSVDPNFQLPGYFTTDLRAGIDLRKANVAVFVHNLFNRRAMSSANNALVPAGGPAWVTFIQPFTVGMQVDVPF
ncbi:TonB-dependent receptor [Paraburkholderia oxyphila]|uniref:TonB-dependent receptor n=1 Tax=Paraburkholderia oxyphila TaxID=614212 RepID=UPI0005B7B981|nr:TonB-dependent receptor [Paraburkholderia oxyphila]